MRALVVAAALLVALPAGATASDAGDVRTLLLRQATLFKQGKWRAMYATYTPRFRRACPYARFLRGQRQTRQVLGTTFRVDRIQVRVQSGGRRALVAYRFVRRNGQVIGQVRLRDGDVYVKIGSRWFDEYDRISSC